MVNNKEKNFISAVLYVHNNEEYIQYFLKHLTKVLSENFEKYEIICVNDNSSDRSIEKIKLFSNCVKGSVISIVNMSFYQGIELSMNAGVDLAIGDFIFEFDKIYVDYDVEMIMNVYNKSLKGFDIVSATPKGRIRRSSQLFYKIYNSYSNSYNKLRTETFRILSRRAINRVHSLSKTIPYRKAVYANCGLKLASLEYESINKNNPIKRTRQIGNMRKDMAVDSFILFTDIAQKMSISMSIVMMFVTLFTGGYTVLVFLSGRKPVEGWTTIMLFLSISFFGLFATLTIIIKYLSIIISLIFKKQEYIIESIEKLTT